MSKAVGIFVLLAMLTMSGCGLVPVFLENSGEVVAESMAEEDENEEDASIAQGRANASAEQSESGADAGQSETDAEAGRASAGRDRAGLNENYGVAQEHQPNSMSEDDIRQAKLEQRTAFFRSGGAETEIIIAKVMKRSYLALNGDIDRLVLVRYDPLTKEAGTEWYVLADAATCAVFEKGYVIEIEDAVVDRSRLTTDGGYQITSCGRVTKVAGPEKDG